MFEQMPVSSFTWKSTGFLVEIIILKEILLGLKRETVGSTDREGIERPNDQVHLQLWSCVLPGFVIVFHSDDDFSLRRGTLEEISI